MQDFLKLFCCLYLCLVLFADNRFVYCEEETLNTFQENAPVAWKEYLDFLKNMEVTWYSETINNNVTTYSPHTTVYNKFPNHLSITNSNDVNIIYGFGNNKSYFFSVSSKDGESWSLDDVQ